MLEIPGQCRCKNWNNCTVQQRKTLRNERFYIMIFYGFTKKKWNKCPENLRCFFFGILWVYQGSWQPAEFGTLVIFQIPKLKKTWETSKKHHLETILMALKPLSVPIFVQVSLFSGGVLSGYVVRDFFRFEFLLEVFLRFHLFQFCPVGFFPVHFFRFMFQIFSVCFFSGYFCRCYSFQIFFRFHLSIFFTVFAFFRFPFLLFFFIFFSGVTFFRCHFSWLLFRLHFLHDQVWFFQVAWKTSTFMLRFHVVFLSFFAPQ